MPTVRPRHQLTETDELAKALDAAEKRWPGVSRGRLLMRLALEGHEAAQQAQSVAAKERASAIRRHSGVLAGLYPRDHRERLRHEWPA